MACRGGGAGGPWTPGASLGGGGGAPAQLVGPNCKKKIRPRQISKVTSLQSAVADAGFTKRGGGAPRAPKAPRVGLCGKGGGVLIRGGGRRCKHCPRALETLGTPLGARLYKVGPNFQEPLT